MSATVKYTKKTQGRNVIIGNGIPDGSLTGNNGDEYINLSATPATHYVFGTSWATTGGGGSNFSRTIYVDSINGNDTGATGQLDKMFKTLEGVVNAIGTTLSLNFTVSGTYTNANTFTVSTGDLALLHIGQTISYSTFIPANTIITNLSGTTVTVSTTLTSWSGAQNIVAWTPINVLCQGDFTPNVSLSYLIDGLVFTATTSSMLNINNFSFLYKNGGYLYTNYWGIRGNWNIIVNGNSGQLLYMNSITTNKYMCSFLEYDTLDTYGTGYAMYIAYPHMGLNINNKQYTIAHNGNVLLQALDTINNDIGFKFKSEYCYGYLGGLVISNQTRRGYYEIKKLESPAGTIALDTTTINGKDNFDFHGVIEGDTLLCNDANSSGRNMGINIYGNIQNKTSSSQVSAYSKGCINVFGNAQLMGTISFNVQLNIYGELGDPDNTLTISNTAIVTCSSLADSANVIVSSGTLIVNGGNAPTDASLSHSKITQSGGVVIIKGSYLLGWSGSLSKTGGTFINEGYLQIQSYAQTLTYEIFNNGGDFINKGVIEFMTSNSGGNSHISFGGGVLKNQGLIKSIVGTGSNSGFLFMTSGAKYQSSGGTVIIPTGKNLMATDSGSRVMQIITGGCNVVNGISQDNAGNVMTDEIGGTLIENVNIL